MIQCTSIEQSKGNFMHTAMKAASALVAVNLAANTALRASRYGTAAIYLFAGSVANAAKYALTPAPVTAMEMATVE